jgi:S1-C subfamily serine protease
VNEHAAQQLGIKGVLVLRVRPGSGAQAAGLEGSRLAQDGSFIPGDVITQVEGKSVDTVPGLLSRLDDFRPGDKVRITILRAGKEEERTVMLQAEGAAGR